MDRFQELAALKEYINDVENETTLLLQNLHWDRKKVLEKVPLEVCSFDRHHRIPAAERHVHEYKCYLSQHGYSKDDILLPEPVDPDADTLVKLSKYEIAGILKTSLRHHAFKRAPNEDNAGPEPLTVERLQQAYSAEERRAIHNAVVNRAPSCHDLTDLVLVGNSNTPATGAKSRMAILSELRNMKRRRVRYRTANKATDKYSLALRDVIKTQMELYGKSHGIVIKTEYGTENCARSYVSLNAENIADLVPQIVIKQERITPEPERQDDCHGNRERQNDDERRKRDKEKLSNERCRGYDREIKQEPREYDGTRERDRDCDRHRNHERYRHSGKHRSPNKDRRSSDERGRREHKDKYHRERDLSNRRHRDRDRSDREHRGRDRSDRGHKDRDHSDRGHKERDYSDRGQRERDHSERACRERDYSDKINRERDHSDREYRDQNLSDRGHRERYHFDEDHKETYKRYYEIKEEVKQEKDVDKYDERKRKSTRSMLGL